MATTATLAGVTLTGAQQPLPIPLPLGDGPPVEQHITRESASQGARRVSVPRRYHESWDDIEINCVITTDADMDTLETSYRARQTVVSYVYAGTTWSCLWAQGGLKVTRFNISLTHYRCVIKLHVLGSA